jgi:Sulfite exporter TauE/SafE
LEDALSVLTRETNPQEWAAAQMKLGMAYQEHLAGNRSQNRERAIAAFENALLVWTRERNPKEVTAARANLEAACRDRFREWQESRVTIGPVAARDIKIIRLVTSAHFMSHFYEIMESARRLFAGAMVADRSGAIGERETTTTALEKEWIASIAVPTAALAIAGIAIAQRAVGDNALALLRNGSAFVSALLISGGFTPAVAGAIAVVLFLAGVVSGLSGFAFSAIAACVLWLLPPLQAVPLIMLLSACNQLLSLGTLRKEVVLRDTAEREGAFAYIAGGIVGAPIGLGLLQTLPPRTLAGGLGLFLIVYAVLVLLKPTGCGSRCRAGSQLWPWALPEASSAGFPLSPGRCRWSIWGCAA